MKIKTSELTATALDWAVAEAAGYKPSIYSTQSIRAELPTGGVIAPFMPGFRWAQGGPIIEREIGNLYKQNKLDSTLPDVWTAIAYVKASIGTLVRYCDGPTPLIAAMRCFVASRLGDEVDVPANLIV